MLFMALEAEQLVIMFEVYFSLERIMRSCYRGVGQEGPGGYFHFCELHAHFRMEMIHCGGTLLSLVLHWSIAYILALISSLN